MRTNRQKCIALAVAAHPDDIEFTMAGALALLAQAGAEIHMWNLANGCLGSKQFTRRQTAAIRWKEAQQSAAVVGATAHPPLFDDLAIFYDAASLARVSAVLRRIRPTIILTHALSDYMEDHQNCARLVVTGTFSRDMKNLVTRPTVAPYDEPVALYHAMPYGLRGPLGEVPRPSHFVEVSRVIGIKRTMLAAHRSQDAWLKTSQGTSVYLNEIHSAALRVGRMSRRFKLAEAFVRHNPLGFSDADWDPLAQLIGSKYCRTALISKLRQK